MICFVLLSKAMCARFAMFLFMLCVSMYVIYVVHVSQVLYALLGMTICLRYAM